MKKRLLAMLMVLMLVVSLLPVGVLADDVPEYYRIRDPQALRTAAITKAGYDPDNLAVGIPPTITTRLYTYDGRYSDANSTVVVGQYYENTSVDATDRGVIMPDEIDRIRVTVSFTDGDYHRHTESVIFDRSEFDWEYDMDSVAGGHDIVWLTLNNTTLSTDGHKVEFYFQPIGKADWELYDIVYVNDGESIGSGMPADPNYGSQNFVSWQTNTDGSGYTLTDITVINKDWVVYGTKTSAGGATAYHVMRDSTGGRHNALQDEVADIYNAENNTAYHSGNVEITAIQVNGNGGEHTNPDYFRNGWRESNRHYYIYNVDDVGLDNHQNTRIPVSEVTGITLTGIIDGNSFSVTIPKDELALQEISNPGTSDTIIEISVCDKLDGITKELVESAEDAPADVTGVSYPVNGKVTIPEDGRVTLLYKITVTGDQNAEYIVTDEGATAVSGSLRGELDANGIAEIYVTKTFSADDVVDGVLTNSASLKNDNTTLPPDDGNDKDEVKVEVEDEGGEEPEPEPEPEEPRDPTDTELSKLAVVLECTNGEVEHAEKAKTFHMRTTNCDLEIQQFGEEYICTVAPDYEKILSTYNTATEATHEYEDGGKQFTLIWSANTNAWEVAGDASITRQVKCETPEPELETVWVYAEVNGVMEEEPIWRGSAKYGASTVDYLNSNKASMPLTRDGYELEDGWFNYDHVGQQLSAETTINGWTNVYVKFTGKPQTVQVMIYRNGDTTKPYATIDVPGYKTGDTIYTEDFNINDYYAKDKFATDFVFDGWFDDGRWNNYKDAGCPEEDFTTVDEIYVNGWKNVIAMVWDVYPVNYHVLDEDGNEIDNKTDYITERDLAGYELWDYSKAGHTFDGWYENDKDIGNDSKKEPVPLAPLKKYELYGLCDPIPQHLEIYAAIDKNKEEAVKIYSDMVDYGTPLVAYLETLGLNTDVFPGYSPEDGKWYKYDSPEWTFGENDTVSGWTNVLINYLPNEYTIYYHGNGGLYKGEHDQVSSTFNYGSTATIKNNVFEKAGYVFIGWADDADGYNILYTGGEKVDFTNDKFPGLLANGKVDLYAVWAEDKLGGGEDGDEPDGIADYRQVFVKYVAADENGVVTPSFDTFDLDVDENGKVMTDVALALSGTATANTDATFAYWTIEGPGYDDFGAYSYEAALSSKDFTGYIAGETYTFTAYFNGPVVKPEEPNVYDIYVTVHNGTATFYGSEVTSSIPAAEGEDITITFTPDEGYTLDYATIDGDMLQIPDNGVYTLKQVDSDHTIEVFYAKDENGSGEDGGEPDGTPDYRQVFVKYVAGDKNGFVTPSHDTFDLDVDENGKVMTDVALALSGTATANTDASFGYWTIEGSGYDGGTYSFEADLENENFSGYLPGETYTFTAYFNGPVVKPELKPYHINVEVVNGTAEFKETNIGANSVINVYPIKDDNKNVEITFVPTDGYVFDAAYVDDESITLSEDNSYTFTEVTADVTIKVLFKQDSVPITPVTPMPTPGEISDLIKDSITVDCVNGEVAHADKVYGLLDGSLVNVEKTGDTSIKVTLDATVYQARYNTDTETKHSLADGQSATVTFALNYVDQKWRVAEGELPITIKVVCETPVEPDPDITGFSKTLVKDRNLYVYQGLAYPTFYRSSVIVDEGDGVTLLYKITVTGTPGTEFTVRDDSADFAQTGEIPDSGETSFYVAKTFSWRDVRNAGDTLDNTASVSVDGETVKTDTERVPVDIDWDFNVPDIDDDDDDDDEDDEVFVPNWLNTEDHYSYIVGYEDGTIKPNNNITRAEVATIFYRLLTDSSRERWYTDSNSFTDVADDSWYNEPVSTLSRMGIINGYEDGSFKPNAPITRAEFTAIATRFFDYSARYDGAFYDVSAGSWYADYIQAAVDMGLVEGYPDGGVHPGSNITRAEAVTIVNRVLNRVPHEDHLLSTRVMNTWPDNKPGAWYYADMQEATNSHDYDWTRVNGKLVEDWTNKLADPNW